MLLLKKDAYFLSVKFGVLPKPGGGIYGLNVKPFHVKAHLACSMHRLGLDYVDPYQPARMDETVPVEELIGALEQCGILCSRMAANKTLTGALYCCIICYTYV